jgi:uncharacterized protein (DUF2147 family)
MRLLILAAALGLASGPALAAETAEGVWLVQDQTAKVRIGPCAGRADELCGDIVWLKAPKDEEGQLKRDDHNPDPKLKARPIMGLQLIRDFQPAGSGKWEGGKIYDPRSGKTYKSKMQLKGGGELEVDGCIAMFCQAQTWRRVG